MWDAPNIFFGIVEAGVLLLLLIWFFLDKPWKSDASISIKRMKRASKSVPISCKQYYEIAKLEEPLDDDDEGDTETAVRK